MALESYDPKHKVSGKKCHLGLRVMATMWAQLPGNQDTNTPPSLSSLLFVYPLAAPTWNPEGKWLVKHSGVQSRADSACGRAEVSTVILCNNALYTVLHQQNPSLLKFLCQKNIVTSSFARTLFDKGFYRLVYSQFL